jgi:hypothetical protein
MDIESFLDHWGAILGPDVASASVDRLFAYWTVAATGRSNPTPVNTPIHILIKAPDEIAGTDCGLWSIGAGMAG